MIVHPSTLLYTSISSNIDWDDVASIAPTLTIDPSATTVEITPASTASPTTLAVTVKIIRLGYLESS